MNAGQMIPNATVRLPGLKRSIGLAPLFLILFSFMLLVPLKALAGPVYTYKLFGEVVSNSDATEVLDGISVGSRFKAEVSIDTRECTTDYVMTCENSVFANIQLGQQSHPWSGSFLTILKDPPLGVQLLFGSEHHELSSSSAQLTTADTGFSFLGDGILGGIGAPPINPEAFESGKFYYSYFYSLNGGQSYMGEVDLHADITRMIVLPEPATFSLLALGLLGIAMLRRRQSAW